MLSHHYNVVTQNVIKFKVTSVDVSYFLVDSPSASTLPKGFGSYSFSQFICNCILWFPGVHVKTYSVTAEYLCHPVPAADPKKGFNAPEIHWGWNVSCVHCCGKWVALAQPCYFIQSMMQVKVHSVTNIIPKTSTISIFGCQSMQETLQHLCWSAFIHSWSKFRVHMLFSFPHMRTVLCCGLAG